MLGRKNMGVNRLFWPQEMMDEWIVDEKAIIADDILEIVAEKKKYTVAQAVHFVSDVGDGDDIHKLVGKVKELDALAQMNAEHYMESVIIEDSAYEVIMGFTGIPIIEAHADEEQNKNKDITGAVKTQAGENASEDKELLARFLLDNL